MFIHNDYDSSVFNIFNKKEFLFNDGKTKVKAEDKIELRFNLKAKGNYLIRPNFRRQRRKGSTLVPDGYVDLFEWER